MIEKERTYPCTDCEKLRTEDEGGTTFTVCDECWEKHYSKEPKADEGRLLSKDSPKRRMK